MPAAALSNHNSCPRRSSRLKNSHMMYDEDSEDSLSLKRVKIEVPDLEEILSPSTSSVNVASVNDKDCEQGFDNISLKDLRARCKAKNRKTSKITSGGSDIKNQTQSRNMEDEKTKDEFDLDKPLVSLKQKRQRTSPSKANKKTDVLTSSLYTGKVEDTTSERNQTTPEQISLLEAVTHGSVIEELETGPADLVHSTIIDDCTKEIAEEEDCCAKDETPVEPENFDIQDIYSEEAETSCCVTPSCPDRDFFDYSSVELQQMSREDEPCFINQVTKLTDVVDHSSELISSTETCNFDAAAEKATNFVSSLDIIDELSDNQETPKDITKSDKYSTGNGFSVCFVNQSCHDYVYEDESWNTEAVEDNEPETVTGLEELSPINKSSTDIMSPLVGIQSDLCGSIDMKCTSLEEVVQMQRQSQLDATPKQVLQDREIKHATTDYTFVFDKNHDLALPANFVTQDGRLESIVYEALNNHTQKMASENTSSVYAISLPNSVQQSLENVNMLNSRIDYGICKSACDEGSGEIQGRLIETCVNEETASCVPSEISVAEETEEILAGAPNSSATSLETENQNMKSDIFIDEESIEDHAPKSLFSKRKIMSPTSQEKLCNALTGIDLCGVKRLKTITVENYEKARISLPQPAHSQEQSAFSMDRRLRGRMPVSPTSNEVPKSGETPSHQHATCSCKRSSTVVLDTEKAVEFSQRQMHDIENIAAKLMRSLKQMKSIVDQTLSSEAYSVVPNFNTAEIRAASEDASEVEKTTRKWLTIMNKDCNRFCKILNLAKKNDVSAHGVPRKQRKITFADEAGGKLCHVKVFKDRNISLSECQSDL
ncbi:hypothetical protein PR202_gb20156 [Eleusine coracana subsp. coracana]|uniref:Uncharacterized protein n=1 Tax=Eleusine coracana subsp. coracana TaxID=191504 RepID=A0AAV5FA05_ELECO|nr:hypothetical protein PR202_gb20156 [Eleusine coracana subsp. coracana]